jgi:hypothetical protein
MTVKSRRRRRRRRRRLSPRFVRHEGIPEIKPAPKAAKGLASAYYVKSLRKTDVRKIPVDAGSERVASCNQLYGKPL